MKKSSNFRRTTSSNDSVFSADEFFRYAILCLRDILLFGKASGGVDAFLSSSSKTRFHNLDYLRRRTYLKVPNSPVIPIPTIIATAPGSGTEVTKAARVPALPLDPMTPGFVAFCKLTLNSFPPTVWEIIPPGRGPHATVSWLFPTVSARFPFKVNGENVNTLVSILKVKLTETLKFLA